MGAPRFATLAAALAALAIGCAAIAPLDAQTSSAAATARAPGENPDAALVSGAAQSGIDEVELSELAAQAASAPEVRRFAQDMLHEHRASNQRLALIAAHENIDVPHALDDEHAELRMQLAQLRGPEFDAAYLDAMVADHERMVGLLESGEATVTTQELRTYIRTTLPGVRGHLALAQTLRR
jgi:putative membrane protein